MIIGTHDSAAYKLDLSVNFWKKTSKWGFLNWLGSWCSFARNRISNLTLTQSLSVYEQLQQGARALDIRVVHKDGIFYVAHTFCCGRLNDTLNDIKKFCTENEEEVVYVLIKPDWTNRLTMKSHEKELMDVLKVIDMNNTRTYYKPLSPIVLDGTFVKSLNDFQFIWLSADNVPEFTKKFKERVFAKKSLLSYALTPKINNVCDVFDISLEEYAKALNPTMKELLSIKQPTIVVVDFFNSMLL